MTDFPPRPQMGSGMSLWAPRERLQWRFLMYFFTPQGSRSRSHIEQLAIGLAFSAPSHYLCYTIRLWYSPLLQGPNCQMPPPPGSLCCLWGETEFSPRSILNSNQTHLPIISGSDPGKSLYLSVPQFPLL